MLDLVVFGSLCDSLKVVSVPGRGSSSGLSQWESGVLTEFVEVEGALVVCIVVDCMFSTTSNHGRNRPWSWLRLKGPPCSICWMGNCSSPFEPRCVSEIAEVLYMCNLSYHGTQIIPTLDTLSAIADNYCLPLQDRLASCECGTRVLNTIRVR